ncbi:MAG: hypothetical protein ABIR91_01700, partial [Candidatus Saccharimonadales bacterium]
MSGFTTYLDLDRTLYRTSIAGVMVWQMISQYDPSIDTAAEHARQRQFYRHQADSYAYDLTAHLQSLRLNVADVYAMLRRSEIADGRLEYDGVADVVAFAAARGDVAVLTYGIDDYQRLKASLCPSLRGIPVITTLQPKGMYLKDTTNALMVDDKAIGDELPGGVRFIQA